MQPPDMRATGSVRFDYFRSNNQLDDKVNFPGATLEVKLESALGSGMDARFEIRVTNPDVSYHGATVASLTEGNFTYRTDRLRVRLGKQIVAWGRTDGINPTDNLTPRDYVVLLPFEEDQRFGTNALTVDAFLNDEFSLSLFTTPFFEPSEIPLPTGQAVFERQPPAHRLSNSEFGARLNRTGGGIDWSVSYFHGYSLFPDFRPTGFISDVPILAVTYAAMDIFGADLSFNLGRYGVRGEVAYHRAKDANPFDPFVRKPYLYWVAGGDRTFDGNLNVNLQLFGRLVKDFTPSASIPDPTRRAVAELDAIISGQQDRHSYGMTARISKTWLNETLKAELLAVMNRTRRDSYLRPLLTYDATDHVKASVGANIYLGAEDTFFGRLKDNRTIFVEVRYAF